jgi:peptidyl-prolyl cis-trans isomerase A (cyclophilin A)
MKKYFALTALFLFAGCDAIQPSLQEILVFGFLDKYDSQEMPKTASQETQSASAAKENTNTMNNTLMFPSKLNEKAPETFKVQFETTKGTIILDVTRAWAPNGADRFYNLVKNGFFTDIAFFRVIDGFMAQFGIHGDPQVSAMWRDANIPDDPVKVSNTAGMVSFATAGPDTRTTQLFINYGNNSFLDGQGFSPFAKVSQGMDVINSVYKGYGEGAPSGTGPNQGSIQMKGNEYLRKYFSKLDYIKSAKIL